MGDKFFSEEKERKKQALGAIKRYEKVQVPIVTAVVLAVALILFGYTYHIVYNLMQDACVERLSDSTEAIASEVSNLIDANFVALDIAAEHLADFETLDFDAAKYILNKYTSEMDVYAVNILLPDNRILMVDDVLEPAKENALDFKEISAKGRHLSLRDESRLFGGKQVVRQYVPIVRYGRIIGVVYAVYHCEDFSEYVPTDIYGGNVTLYIIDRRDGSVIADTHDGIFDNIRDRMTRSGVDESYADSILGGELCTYMIRGGTTGREIYVCSAPTTRSEYSVSIGIFRDVAMASITDYRRFIVYIALAEILLFAGYDFWMVRRNRKNIERISNVADTDVLTGAGSMLRFTQVFSELDAMIASGTAPAFAIVECDINDLKKVNDSRGHDAGSLYIRNCCSVMDEAFPNSQIYRIGGDEFALVLIGQDYENRQKLMDKMRAQKTKQNGVELSFASGISDFDPANDHAANDVLKRADVEMYKNKQTMKAAKAQ